MVVTRNVFTYGSLMFPEVWTLVVEGRHVAVAATLANHARFAVRDQSYPGMIQRTDDSVTGVLHLDVDEDDVGRLDHFEGDDYRRETVEVTCADGLVRSAETYVYRLEDHLLASPWQPDAFAMQDFIETYCRDRLGS